MLDAETKENLEALLVELEERLKVTDPDWEDVEHANISKQIEATRALLEDQGADSDRESVDDAEVLPPALMDPKTGERYTENPFGYAEPDSTRPDGADGPSLSPAEIVKKDSSASRAKRGGKKSSEAAPTNSETTDILVVINENAADMRAELDTPEKIFLFYRDKCWINPVQGSDGKPIYVPPSPVRDAEAVRNYGLEKGIRPVQVDIFFDEAWAEIVGGRFSLGSQHNWEVLYRWYEKLKAYTVPEINEWEEIEQILFENYSITEPSLNPKDLDPEQEKADWDRVMLAKRQAEDEIKVLTAQFQRMLSVPERELKYLETMFIQSPAAEDFIARHAKKGTKYVDLPHGRLQQRKVSESLECFDETKFMGYVGKKGEAWAASMNMERRVEWRAIDQRGKIKGFIKEMDNPEEAGYRRRPEYQSTSTSYGD
jgi:hypothetical protein